MEEENVTQNPDEEKGTPVPELGKFKSVDALARAYSALEAEFTRRSQRLKALEEQLSRGSEERTQGNENADTGSENGAKTGEGEQENAPEPMTEPKSGPASEGGDMHEPCSHGLAGVRRGVPLMGGVGAGIPAPAVKPATFQEAGALALGYLRKTKH